MNRACIWVLPLLTLAGWGCEAGPTAPTSATSKGAAAGATSAGATTAGSTSASTSTTANAASSGTSTGGASTGFGVGASAGSSGTAAAASTGTSGSAGTSGTAASSTSGGSTSGAYSVTDLGAAQVESINDSGQVAGETCASDQCLAAVWQAATGWVTTPLPNGGAASVAVGVDQAGDLAMNVAFPFGQTTYWRGYTSPPTQPIPTTSPEGGSNLANAIDFATGHIVGYDRGLGGGFLFDGTTMTPIAAKPGSDDLGDPSNGFGQATAVNAADQVAGWVRTTSSANAPEHAFIWDHGNLRDLGTLGQDARSAAVAINDSGAVVGWSKPGTEGVEGRRIFLWDGTMHALGCPSSAITCTPSGINAQGDVVGTAQDSLATEAYPFIFRNGQFTRLDALVQNASGWIFEDVRSINDSGQIVGTGLLNGSPHAFLLSP